MRGPATKLVFLHIPKCAGTSVHSALSASFDRSEIFPRYGHDLQNEQLGELRRYRYLAGHFSMYGVQRVPSPKWTLTVLREPKSRVLSLYYFWRSFTDAHIAAKDLKGPRMAKTMGLLEFLTSKDPFILHNIRNTQCRSLVGPMHVNPPSEPYNSGWLVEVAFGNLVRFNYVGFAETLDDDLKEICRRFVLVPSETTPRVNAFGDMDPNVSEAVRKEPMTPDIEAALAEHVRLDTALYERAFAVRAGLRCPYPS